MSHIKLGSPLEKGIDPPQSIGSEFWDSYWLKWFKRLADSYPKIQTYHTTLTPSSVSANSTSEQTFTITGLNTNDLVIINKPSHQSGLGIGNARVSAANTLAITYMNVSGGAIVPTSEEYSVVVIRL